MESEPNRKKIRSSSEELSLKSLTTQSDQSQRNKSSLRRQKTRRSIFSSQPCKKKSPNKNKSKSIQAIDRLKMEALKNRGNSNRKKTQIQTLQRIDQAEESISPEERKMMAKKIWMQIDDQYFPEISQATSFATINRVLQIKFPRTQNYTFQSFEVQISQLTGYQFDQTEDAIDSLLDELGKVVTQNNQIIGNLPIQIAKQKPKLQISLEQLLITKDLLHWAEVLRYFVRGFTDKSAEVLKRFSRNKESEPKKGSLGLKYGKQTKTDKWSQTQCKICFCCEDVYENAIVYCDGCSTSFHQYCYGLPQLPQQQIYKCDVCLWNQKNVFIDKVRCSICKKASFPMKRVEGYFYHVTCLVVNNFIQYKNYLITPREGVTRALIASRIKQNQSYRYKQGLFCNYCTHHDGCRDGMQIMCRWRGCPTSFHPICGYLAGCKFRLQVYWQNEMPRLEFKGQCSKHGIAGRDIVFQAYLRCFACNFLSATDKTQEEFRQYFAKQEKLRQERRLQLSRQG